METLCLKNLYIIDWNGTVMDGTNAFKINSNFIKLIDSGVSDLVSEHYADYITICDSDDIGEYFTIIKSIYKNIHDIDKYKSLDQFNDAIQAIFDDTHITLNLALNHKDERAWIEDAKKFIEDNKKLYKFFVKRKKQKPVFTEVNKPYVYTDADANKGLANATGYY